MRNCRNHSNEETLISFNIITGFDNKKYNICDIHVFERSMEVTYIEGIISDDRV